MKRKGLDPESGGLGRPPSGVSSKVSQLCETVAGRSVIKHMVLRGGAVFRYANANGVTQVMPAAIVTAFTRVYDMPAYLDVHRCIATTVSDGHAKLTFPSSTGDGYTQAMIYSVDAIFGGKQKKADWHLVVHAFDEIMAREAAAGSSSAAGGAGGSSSAGGMSVAEVDQSFLDRPAMPLDTLGSHLRPGLAYGGSLGADIKSARTFESLEVVAEHTLFNSSRDNDDVCFNYDVLCTESVRLGLPTCHCYARLMGGQHCSLWKKTVRAAQSKAVLSIMALRGGGAAAAAPEHIERGTFNNINDASYRP